MPLATPSEPKKYTTVYNDFRGVDFTNDAASVYKRRSPYAINIKPDAGGVPYKRNGWRVAHETEQTTVRNMWSFDFAEESHLIYVVGKTILRLGNDVPVYTLLSEDTYVTGVYFNSALGGKFYFIADSKLLEYYKDSNGVYSAKEITPYIPTVLIGREPSGGGTIYENINLLTSRRKESFLGNDTDKEYYVASEIDITDEIIVQVRNETGDFKVLVADTDYTVSENSITFTDAHAPVVDGEDNVIIEYTSSNGYGAASAIKKCTVATVYDSRVFLSGSSGDYKSRVWYSALNNAAYFPDLSYIVVGDDYGGVMGLIGLGEYLGVIKESNPEASTIFLAYPITFDDDTTYAVKQSITGVGAVSKRTFHSLNGEQLFLSDDGIYGIMADMDATEVSSSFVKNRSYYINGKLLQEPNLEEAISIVWDGFYILCVNSHCYVLDGTQKSSWANERTNLQYEAYYWENIPATAFCVYDKTLYFGTKDGKICHFKDPDEYGNEAYNDNNEPIACEWRTIFDDDGAVNFFKNLQKKGCVVVLQNVANKTSNTSAEIWLQADDKEQIYVGSIAANNINVPNEFYVNKKVKKYKRLQFIVKNSIINEAFGVKEIVKVYTIGNYSKNSTEGVETYTFFLQNEEDLYVNGYGIDDMELTTDESTGTSILFGEKLKLEYDANTGDLYYYDEDE